MLAENGVIGKWNSGSVAVTAWMSTHSLLVAQAMASSGADAVVIDMQHGSATLDDALGLIASIEVRGAEPFVRVPAVDDGLIGRLLDAGATGIIAPLINSAEQASAFLDAMLYPPLGSRSYGPRVPAFRWGSKYAQSANRLLVSLAMIETSAGLAALDSILALEQLTGVFVGPSDLSMSLGFPPPQARQPGPVSAAIDRIVSQAGRAGKMAGIFSATSAAAEAAVAAGFDLVTTPPDLALIDGGTRSAIEAMRKLDLPNTSPQ